MGNIPSFGPITSLTSMTDMRNMSTCADTISAADCERVVLGSKWHNWYYSDLTYGQASVYFFVAGLAFFTLLDKWFLVRHRLSGSSAWRVVNDPIQIWLSAAVGYLSSRQLRINPRFGYTLSLGDTLIVCGMILFFSIITLAPSPYYWPSPDYGYSPPIATRSGFLAIGILPFQVMFAAKWSPITVLTGVSHERLQVFHRWSGWIMYVLALIHTFPFIITNIANHEMVELWHTDWTTFSGVMCLIPQTILVAASIGVIRDRFYETFKSIHYIMAAWFIVVLFIHCDFILTSALYFVGFAATYALSLAVRWGRALYNGFSHKATVDVLDAYMLRTTIPTTLRWRPGQHYFFRFLTPSVHALTSHPFSIASACAPDGGSEMVLYMKKQKGMTRALFDAAEKGQVGVLLDGPYGGYGVDLARYDRVLLVGGGSGGSVILGTLLDLVAKQANVVCKHVDVVYACREPSDAKWFFSALAEAAKRFSGRAEVHLHVTRQAAAVLPDKPLSTPDLEADMTVSDDMEGSKDHSHDQSSALLGDSQLPGRPDLAAHVRAATAGRGTAAVVVCGPKEMSYEVRNAVAAEQVKILKGTVGCVECFLHTETFGW